MVRFNDEEAQKRVAELHKKEEENFLRSTASRYGYQYINLEDVTIDVEALQRVPEEKARAAELAVFAQGNNSLSVGLHTPELPEVIPVLSSLSASGTHLDLYLVSSHSLEHAWKRYRDVRTAIAETKGVLDINVGEIERLTTAVQSHLDVAELLRKITDDHGGERVTKCIETIFGGALSLHASDIHIEPEARGVRVRYRLDGVLFDVAELPSDIYRLLISRLKLLSGVKLNRTNVAQDGRFTFDVGSRKVEIRASVIPGGYGESMVMRLLDPDASRFTLNSLGLNAVLERVMQEELSRPNGAIITTGPTGSGKSTALYAFLQHVHTPEIKIITIEDPIEYKIPGVVQTQTSKGYDFGNGLRSILRQDPDVIMVGEIRDREVAEIAVHAALTGHLVFSTLHTNSAVGAFPRLIDLGIDARMIGSAFNIILGQRLVRKVCTACRVERDATTEEQKLIARIMNEPVALHRIFEAKGCAACGGSGYKGRIGVYEAVRVDKAVEEAVVSDPRELTILEAARPQGIPTMQQDGMMKVLAGITSLDEVSRVLDLYSTDTNTAGR